MEEAKIEAKKEHAAAQEILKKQQKAASENLFKGLTKDGKNLKIKPAPRREPQPMNFAIENPSNHKPSFIEPPPKEKKLGSP